MNSSARTKINSDLLNPLREVTRKSQTLHLFHFLTHASPAPVPALSLPEQISLCPLFLFTSITIASCSSLCRPLSPSCSFTMHPGIHSPSAAKTPRSSTSSLKAPFTVKLYLKFSYSLISQLPLEPFQSTAAFSQNPHSTKDRIGALPPDCCF